MLVESDRQFSVVQKNVQTGFKADVQNEKSYGKIGNT